MKIVQIGGFLFGAQKTIETCIHKALLDLGHSSYIFYEYGESSDKYIQRYENRIENIITRGLRKAFGKNSCFSRIQTIRLIHKLNIIQPDIIHLHVIHDGCLDYTLLFKYIIENNVAVVYTMHDLWAVTGGCYHYTSQGCNRYIYACTQCNNSEKYLDCKKKNVSKEYEKKRELLLGIKNYTSVSVSRWVQDEIKKSYLAERPIYTVYNCIDKIDEEKMHKYNVPDRRYKYRIISIAQTWDTTKGIEKIYELASMMPNFEFLLVGNIDSGLKSNAPENVLFFGYCNDKNQLYRLLSEADINVSLSLEETFGMTFVEAAIMGTKSIGFKSTAICEILEITNGIAVFPLTIQAMEKEIRTIILERKNKLSNNEIYIIKNMFSEERMTREYIDIYNRTLKKKEEN